MVQGGASWAAQTELVSELGDHILVPQLTHKLHDLEPMLYLPESQALHL